MKIYLLFVSFLFSISAIVPLSAMAKSPAKPSDKVGVNDSPENIAYMERSIFTAHIEQALTRDQNTWFDLFSPILLSLEAAKANQLGETERLERLRFIATALLSKFDAIPASSVTSLNKLFELKIFTREPVFSDLRKKLLSGSPNDVRSPSLSDPLPSMQPNPLGSSGSLHAAIDRVKNSGRFTNPKKEEDDDSTWDDPAEELSAKPTIETSSTASSPTAPSVSTPTIERRSSSMPINALQAIILSKRNPGSSPLKPAALAINEEELRLDPEAERKFKEELLKERKLRIDAENKRKEIKQLGTKGDQGALDKGLDELTELEYDLGVQEKYTVRMKDDRRSKVAETLTNKHFAHSSETVSKEHMVWGTKNEEFLRYLEVRDEKMDQADKENELEIQRMEERLEALEAALEKQDTSKVGKNREAFTDPKTMGASGNDEDKELAEMEAKLQRLEEEVERDNRKVLKNKAEASKQPADKKIPVKKEEGVRKTEEDEKLARLEAQLKLKEEGAREKKERKKESPKKSVKQEKSHEKKDKKAPKK